MKNVPADLTLKNEQPTIRNLVKEARKAVVLAQNELCDIVLNSAAQTFAFSEINEGTLVPFAAPRQILIELLVSKPGFIEGLRERGTSAIFHMFNSNPLLHSPVLT